jgi:hypothetical protein
VCWFLSGAQAASLHGVARLSADIGVTVDSAGRSSPGLVGSLSESGFERGSRTSGFVEGTRVLRYPWFVWRPGSPSVLSSSVPVPRSNVSPARKRVVAGAGAHVVRLEDLVVMKCSPAGRPPDLLGEMGWDMASKRRRSPDV